MNRPTLNQPADLWHVDGSLRDIYVFSTIASDWDALLVLAQTYPHEYTQDGIPHSLPAAAALFRDREHSHLLSILTGAVRINCHFFVPEEIELDIDPWEVIDQEKHVAVLQFVERLAQATRKDAVVTPENTPDKALLQYDHASQVWQVHELPASDA
ncbi:hypothetical protein [Aquabacterium sp. OR-4]|uniref:hypothetical protein n=1 Tax=Aquabacterium sp. OR-4 TaxID=2978127 RepID=UPI0021B4B8A3|nr:hypothetical protein [Aquabacterium sp. OR-4]MDT7836906.1 hypothetical protein [Aquabacterium sp. OR-4]MDT7839097.1 hypothetical protein [Aquabacterium sp. OR-4]